MGSRFGGLKQLAEVGPTGSTILEYSLHDAIQAGFGRVVFVIRQSFAAEFEARIIRRIPQSIEVFIVFQELEFLPDGFEPPAGRTKPWGTAHALWVARDAIPGPFAVINADDFYGRDAFNTLAHFCRSRATAAAAHPAHGCMVSYALHNTLSAHGTVSRGICQVAADSRLTSIEEVTAIAQSAAGPQIVSGPRAGQTLPPDLPVSMNCFAFDHAFLAHVDASLVSFLGQSLADPKAECYLPVAVTQAMASGALHIQLLPTAGLWLGVTYPDDAPAVAAALRHLSDTHQYPAILWPDAITIRPAASSELAAVIALDAALFAFDRQFDPTLDMEWSQSAEATEFFAARIAGDDGCCFVAALPGALPFAYLAGAIVEPLSYRAVGPLAEIECLFVDPRFRGARIGERMVVAFKEWAAARNIHLLRADVSADNKDALRFYAKLGLIPYNITVETPA
jgi:ribosomal protein S18 acetylase RimI-like enzyme